MKTTSQSFSVGINAVVSGNFPAWRQGKAVGQWFPIIGTEADEVVAGVTASGTSVIDAWNGLGSYNGVLWNFASGGHGVWENRVFSIDLKQDAPKWTLNNSGSVFADVTLDAYYRDGKPMSSHTYYNTQFVRGSNAFDGKNRVMRFTSAAGYSQGMPGSLYAGGPKVDGYRTDDNVYDQAGTFPDAPIYIQFLATAKDADTDDVYVQGGDSGTGRDLAKWTAATNTWTQIQTTPSYPEVGRMLSWQLLPAFVDKKRNRICALHDGRNWDPQNGPRMQCVDLTSGYVTNIPITGLPTATIVDGSGVVHDLDNDRYLYLAGKQGETPQPLYAINPTTGAATSLPGIAVQSDVIFVGVENRFQYLPELGGVAYHMAHRYPVYFLPTR